MNMACIAWYTKRQATIESAVFDSELIAIKYAMEMSRGLWYKSRMMDVPLEGQPDLYGKTYVHFP